MKLPPDLRDFLRLLDENSVDYAIVGGWAVTRHGHPRFTGDLDVLVRPSPENARRLLKVLQVFGFGSLDLHEEDFAAPGSIVQLGVAPVRIDLMTSIQGVSTEQVLDRRVTDQDQQTRLYFISREDLIANKRASGRPQDLADLDLLQANQRRRPTE